MIARLKAEAGLLAICFLAVAPLLAASVGLAFAVTRTAGRF